MSKNKNVLVQPPSAEQHAMADFLLFICPSNSFLVKHAVKRYITLDEQVGKSTNNKNAVSILQRHTSFMVPDWSFCARAEQIGLIFESIDDPKVGRRLAFPKLTVDTINETPGADSFFRDLLLVAKKEAQDRQTRRLSATKASRIDTNGHSQGLGEPLR